MKAEKKTLLNCCTNFHPVMMRYIIVLQYLCVISIILQLHTADLGGQGSTSEVVQSIMNAVQSTGPQTLSI